MHCCGVSIVYIEQENAGCVTMEYFPNERITVQRKLERRIQSPVKHLR